jgi:hypothetical protein
MKREDAADTERERARKQAQTAAERAEIEMQASEELVKVDEELNSYITENRKGDDASQLAWAPLSEAIGHSRTMNMRLSKSKTWKEHQGAINDVPNDRQVYKFAHEEWARQCRGERNADSVSALSCVCISRGAHAQCHLLSVPAQSTGGWSDRRPASFNWCYLVHVHVAEAEGDKGGIVLGSKDDYSCR